MNKYTADSINRLNDLTGKEWLQLSRSWWFQKGLGRTHPDAIIESQHPAPFSFHDVQKLIRFLTKPGMTVLDPFCGVASTLKAAALCGRNAIGIEISSRWVSLGKSRLAKEVPDDVRRNLQLRIIRGDCLKKLPKLPSGSIDLIVTSPPYWRILNKSPDHKTKLERLDRGLETKYSSSKSDLGNIKSYEEFLKMLGQAMNECNRVLKPRCYIAMVIGDFRHGSDFYPFHTHVMALGEKAGFELKGITVLIQNNKRLFPYGYPHTFVQNIHHQYILTFQKP